MRLAAFSSPSALTSTLRTNSSPPTPSEVWLSTVDGELAQHLAHFVARHVVELGHAAAQALHVLGAQMLEDLGGLALAQRQQQDGRALDAVALAFAAAHSSVDTHDFTTCAPRFGSADDQAARLRDLLFVGDGRRFRRAVGRTAGGQRRERALAQARRLRAALSRPRVSGLSTLKMMMSSTSRPASTLASVCTQARSHSGIGFEFAFGRGRLRRGTRN